MMAKSAEKTAAPSTESTVPERASWDSPVEFILSCLNYAVGLGNVWRFPYLVYRNGGGAFLIPYILMMFVMGLPIFFLELVVGQYSGIGPNKAFARMAPFFHGVGYCTLVIITIFTIYYQVIIGWTVFYIYESFRYELGWGSCNHDYNTEYCFSQTQQDACQLNVDPFNSSSYSTYHNKSCHFVSDLCAESDLTVYGMDACQNATGTVVPLRYLYKRVLASEEFYNDYILGIGDATWEDWGILRWQNVVSLFVAWVIAYMCVIKGIATIGKVVYFTTIFPFIMLTALLIRGVTLPGAYEGIMFYITPKWELLLEARVWGDAASQTFYAMGICCGSLVTLASYNKFDNNCHRDALFIGTVITLTSIYAGFAVFSILGFMANQLGVPVDEVVQDGPGLAFIAYPEAVLQMPLPQLWAVLFFLMLAILGLGTQFAGIQAINTFLLDQWPASRKYTYLVTGGTCLSCFVLALPMCCQGGVYLFTLLDWNTASWAIMIVGLMELVVVAHVYGAWQFIGNVREMSIALPRLGARFWWLVWVVLAPLATLGVLIFLLMDFTDAYYGTYDFPPWVDGLGYAISLSTLVPLPIFGIYQFVKNRRRNGDLRDLFIPSKKWGPQTTKQPISACPSFDSTKNLISSTHGNDEKYQERTLSYINAYK